MKITEENLEDLYKTTIPMKLVGMVYKPINEKLQNWYNSPEEETPFTETMKISDINDLIFDIMEKSQNVINKISALHSPVEMEIPKITCKYGPRKLDYKGAKASFHYGLDLKATQDSPVFAVEDATVLKVVHLNPKAINRFVWSNKEKKRVLTNNGAITPKILYIGHETGNYYWHKHAEGEIDPGKEVQKGDMLGHYGDYGYSLGSHCHLELWIKHYLWNNGGRPKDPQKYLKKHGIGFLNG